MFVEGRHFNGNQIYAFTFAQIQADRMGRAVEVHTARPGQLRRRTWHATAHPSHFARSHLVTES